MTRVPCPECKFTNRPDDARCVYCKADLPKTAAKPDVADYQLTRRFSRAKARPRRPQPRVQPKTLLPEPTGRLLSKAFLWSESLPPIPLDRPRLVIGRHRDCDLVLPAKEVSRRHAIIKTRGAKVIVFQDQGSSNGSWVNGERAAGKPIVLHVGDALQIGPYALEVRGSATLQTEEDSSTKMFKLLEPSAAVSGKLEEMPLSEILQAMEFNKKTGTLLVESDRETGVVVVERGAPLVASWGDKRDDEAVIAMIALHAGSFSLTSHADPVEPTMASTLSSILFEASRRFDEGPDDDTISIAVDLLGK